MKVIIFDVDGVLVDVRESYHLAIKKTAEFFLGREVSLGYIREVKFSKAINNDWDVTYEVLRSYGLSVDYTELVDKFAEFYEKLKFHEKQLLPADFFRGLREKKVPLGIVTGRPRKDLIFALERFNLSEFFKAIVDEDDVPDKRLRKPHPFPLHLCMKMLGASEGVYVGDSKADMDMVLSYRKMYGKPMKFVHFTKVSEMRLEADFSTDDPQELMSFLLREVCPNRGGERVSRP